ncbi:MULTISPECIES: hypothetical protein [unclassified Streptomyces]|uniref:hypothetical protein n=1 Tax=unclassified Streptomyces TaxID=2593676 RepID=UPI001146A726|nr:MULTISPECIES: hypothetical protein [unclassified Streptomyces]MCM1974624.1 hypothetical protein [Streptomyces sp. G1]
MSTTDEPSAEYVRGWRDGYAQGRDDEAAGADLRDGPPGPRQRRQQAGLRDRQIRHPGRDR